MTKQPGLYTDITCRGNTQCPKWDLKPRQQILTVLVVGTNHCATQHNLGKSIYCRNKKPQFLMSILMSFITINNPSIISISLWGLILYYLMSENKALTVSHRHCINARGRGTEGYFFLNLMPTHFILYQSRLQRGRRKVMVQNPYLKAINN